MQIMPLWVHLTGTWENDLFYLHAILRHYLDIEKKRSLSRPGTL